MGAAGPEDALILRPRLQESQRGAQKGFGLFELAPA